MFNSGTLVIPSQAEGNPFYTLVEDLHREADADGGIVQMKLDKTKIMETESYLNTLLTELIQI